MKLVLHFLDIRKIEFSKSLSIVVNNIMHFITVLNCQSVSDIAHITQMTQIFPYSL